MNFSRDLYWDVPQWKCSAFLNIDKFNDKKGASVLLKKTRYNHLKSVCFPSKSVMGASYLIKRRVLIRCGI